MPVIENKPTRFRSAFNKGGSLTVDREGGKFGKGVIYSTSIITRGEALGHELWVDQTFLSQVEEGINSSPTGIKARFTHPGLSSDGVGTKLGKFYNAVVKGDQVFADLHFQEAAYNTPDGDLATYVLSLAEDTPEDFGLSIVFDHDFEASEEYDEAVSLGAIQGDKGNEEGYSYARLSRIYSCDAVDSPAANPSGLFKRGQESAIDADAYLQYVLGLSDVKPTQSSFAVDGDRAKQFVARFLSRQGVTLSTLGEDKMADAIDAPVEDTQDKDTSPSRADFNAELGAYVTAFGVSEGTGWFLKGVAFGEAQSLHIKNLTAKVADLSEKLAASEAKIASLALGEDEGTEFSADDAAEKEKSLSSKIRISGKNYGK
jgi:hypothetical protein